MELIFSKETSIQFDGNDMEYNILFVRCAMNNLVDRFHYLSEEDFMSIIDVTDCLGLGRCIDNLKLGWTKKDGEFKYELLILEDKIVIRLLNQKELF